MSASTQTIRDSFPDNYAALAAQTDVKIGQVPEAESTYSAKALLDNARTDGRIVESLAFTVVNELGGHYWTPSAACLISTLHEAARTVLRLKHRGKSDWLSRLEQDTNAFDRWEKPWTDLSGHRSMSTNQVVDNVLTQCTNYSKDQTYSARLKQSDSVVQLRIRSVTLTDKYTSDWMIQRIPGSSIRLLGASELQHDLEIQTPLGYVLNGRMASVAHVQNEARQLLADVDHDNDCLERNIERCTSAIHDIDFWPEGTTQKSFSIGCGDQSVGLIITCGVKIPLKPPACIIPLE